MNQGKGERLREEWMRDILTDFHGVIGGSALGLWKLDGQRTERRAQ